MPIFMVLSSWQTIARVHPVHLMNVERRQAAADPQTKTNDLGCESTCRLPESTPTIAIYYYYSAESWYSFYHPVEGRRLSRPSLLVTYRDGLPVHWRSPILVLTGSDVAQLRWSGPMHYHQVLSFIIWLHCHFSHVSYLHGSIVTSTTFHTYMAP